MKLRYGNKVLVAKLSKQLHATVDKLIYHKRGISILVKYDGSIHKVNYKDCKLIVDKPTSFKSRVMKYINKFKRR